ncbi:MAG: ShlB/FhaC/HecB family hemolysin secretion/activation protein [Pseudomonadota bacterium]|nr:ShlB/FhaC/HecB family hemolysin secretion/activation protein [Pseudomonadota bacterium]
MLGAWLGSVALGLPQVASAQSASDILPPTREEVTREQTVQPQIRAPRVEVEGVVERSPCALDGPEFAAIRLQVQGVEFQGLKGMTAAELGPAYRYYVGREEPIAVVCEIRDRVATMLRNAGYVAAVQVPEQRIANGVIRFNILMAHLTQVRVRGDAGGAEHIIAGYMNQLTKQDVFNKYQAERYLLLASDIPGYNIRLTLRPAGTQPGEVIGDVTVQHMPVYVDANIQNSGSHSLGPWGGLLRGQIFGLTGLGDRTTISGFTTSDLKEQQTVQLGHDFRIGGEGLSVSDLFTYAWARPTIPNTKVRANTLLNTFELDYPFVRKLTQSIRGAAGMDFVNQDVKLDGIDLTRDRLRVGFARVTADSLSDDFSRSWTSLAEPFWRLSGQVELRKGLSIFGATGYCGPTGAKCLGPGVVPPSRLEGRATAVVLRSTAFAELRPIRNVTFGLTVRAQTAWQPLLSFEEYSAGNYTVGRGYDPGTLIGDRGFGTQSEIRFGSRVQRTAKKPAIETYAFWDYARISNLDKLTILDQSNHLNSVGGGARIGFGRFALDAAVAVPLTRVGLLNEKPSPRFLVSLTSRLWPWSLK